MSDKMALQIAIDLLHIPSQVGFVRSAPLPDGIAMLLRIAAGDEEAELRGAALVHRSRDVVRQAAAFFIEQILFAPHTDSYRVLGATPHASAGDLRKNLALLTKWLHPDRNARNDRSIFIDRVTAAWNDLKTPERRATYDRARQRAMSGREPQSTVRSIQSRKRENDNAPIAARHRLARHNLVRRPYRGQRIGLFRLVLFALFRRPL